MRVVLTLALGLAASPVLAFAPERAGLMVDAIRANGCSMTGEQAEGALAPLGLGGDEVQVFVDTLFGAEMVTMSEDNQTLFLVPTLCEAPPDVSMAMIVFAFQAQETSLEPWRPEFTAERGAEFIGALRGAGCSLTEESAATVLVPLGFTPSESRDIVSVLIEGGLGQVSDDGASFGLSPQFCAADPAGDVPELTAILSGWETPEMPDVIIQRGVTP